MNRPSRSRTSSFEARNRSTASSTPIPSTWASACSASLRRAARRSSSTAWRAHRCHARGRRDLAHAGLEPIDVAGVADEEERARHVLDRRPRPRRRPSRRSGRGRGTAASRAAGRRPPARLESISCQASRSRCCRHASGATAATASSKRRNGSRCASIARPSWPGACWRYHRAVDLDEPVDPAHQLVEHRRRRAHPRAPRSASQRLNRAGHVARDPIRADHVGGLRPGLRDEPRHERDALGVDDVVRYEHRDQLPTQRMLREQVPEPLHHRRGEVATGGPAARYSDSGSAESRIAFARLCLA